MGDFVLVRVGRRVVNLRYLIWSEDECDGDAAEAAFEAGRVFRFEGDDAQTWREFLCFYTSPPGRPMVSYGSPAPRPDEGEPLAG